MRRRGFLTAAAGSLVLLSGCIADENSSPEPTNKTPSSSSSGDLTVSEVPDDVTIVHGNPMRDAPQCGDTDADAILEVSPDGIVIETGSESKATNISANIEQTLNLQNSSKVAIRRGGNESDPRYLVDLAHGRAGLQQFREQYENTSEVHNFQFGRPLPVVANYIPDVKSVIRDHANPDRIEIQLFDSQNVLPNRIFALIYGVDSFQESVPNDVFQWRVETDNGTRTVLTAAGVQDVSDYRPSRGDGYIIPIELTEEATSRVINRLEGAGALAESRGQRKPIQTYFDGEQLSSEIISNDLRDNMKSGEWNGLVAVPVDSEEKAKQVSERFALNLSFPPSFSVDVHNCSSN
jgi:hypothetical protein